VRCITYTVSGLSYYLCIFTATRKSLDPVLIIRALACLGIIWYHAEPPLKPLLIGHVNIAPFFGNWGGTFVFIFYLLSGYAIGYGFFSHKYRLSLLSMATYITKRFFRIAPAYYLVIIICYAYIYRSAVAFRWDDFFRYITFRANEYPWGLPFGGNHAMVSTEMQFYIMAPVFYVLLTLFVRKIPPIFSVIFTILGTLAIKLYLASLGYIDNGLNYHKHVYGQVFGNIDLFVFGMLLSFLVIHHSRLILALKKKIPSIATYITIVLWLMWANWHSEYFVSPQQWPIMMLQRYYLLPLSICILIGWSIVSFSIGKTIIPVGKLSLPDVIKLLIRPRTFLHGVGVLSYGIFLWQYPVYYFLFKHPGGPEIVPTWIGFFWRFGTVTGVSICIALISYTLLERPIMWCRSKLFQIILTSTHLYAIMKK
jgi:peptidoglycan/LPS O-acetylase OafA/YrhL